MCGRGSRMLMRLEHVSAVKEAKLYIFKDRYAKFSSEQW
jgi:hypothetical protein